MTRLRPVEAHDLDLVTSVNRDPRLAGTSSWFGFGSDRSRREQFDENGFLSDTKGMLIVEDQGEAVGAVSWHEVSYGPGPGSNCWNIGVWLHPDGRGRGIGTTAQAQLVDYLFDTTPVERVEAATDVDNVAEQRALDKAGFQREGVLRQVQFRAGELHDLVVYSRLRTS